MPLSQHSGFAKFALWWKSQWPLILILLLGFCLSAYAVWWGLPSTRGWAPDELTPWRVFAGLKQRFSNGWHTRYPPFHFYLLTLFYSPAILLHLFDLTNVFDPGVQTILFLTGRMISVFMGLGVIFTVYLCGRELSDRTTALFAALMITLTAPFVYHAKITTLDIPYLFWFSLSLLFGIRILKSHRARDYLLFTATAVLAVCTKDQAYGLYVLTLPLLLFDRYRFMRSQRESLAESRKLLDATIIGCSLLGLALFVGIYNLPFNAQGFLAHVKVIRLMGEGSQLFENSLSGHAAMLWQILKQVPYALGWPLTIAAFAGIGYALARRRQHYCLLATLVPGISYYIFFVGFTRFPFVRYLLPLLVILALFGGLLLSRLTASGMRLRKPAYAIVGAALVYSFFYANSINLLLTNDARYAAEAWMDQNVGPGAVLAGIGREHYLPRLKRYGGILLSPSTDEIERAAPDYIVINTSYLVYNSEYRDAPRFRARAEQERAFVAKLTDGSMGFTEVFSARSDPALNLLKHDGMITNFDLLQPEIRIFRRSRETPQR